MTLTELMAYMQEHNYNAIKVRQSHQGMALFLKRE